MSKGVKITLIVGGVVIALCAITCVSLYFIGGYTFSRTVADNPQKAATVGHEIVDYRLPAGYREQMGMSIMGVKMVMIAQGDGESTEGMVLVMMQFPDNTRDMDEMRSEMERALARQTRSNSVDYKPAGTREVMIKGQPVTFAVQESVSSPRMRQMMGVFPGRDDKWVILMAMGEIDNWDQDLFDQFAGSIK